MSWLWKPFDTSYTLSVTFPRMYLPFRYEALNRRCTIYKKQVSFNRVNYFGTSAINRIPILQNKHASRNIYLSNWFQHLVECAKMIDFGSHTHLWYEVEIFLQSAYLLVVFCLGYSFYSGTLLNILHLRLRVYSLFLHLHILPKVLDSHLYLPRHHFFSSFFYLKV